MDKQKVRREWGQWKRRMLSKQERKELSFGMFVDFTCAKGYFETIFNPQIKKDN